MEFLVPPPSLRVGLVNLLKQQGLIEDESLPEVAFSVLQTVKEIILTLEKHFARYRLSQGRFALLLMLASGVRESWTPADLAEQGGVTRATVTGFLNVLEKMKYIERRQDAQDRRRWMIHLTADGKQFLQEILPDHFRRVPRIFAAFSAEERQELVRLLGKLRQGLQAMQQN